MDGSSWGLTIFATLFIVTVVALVISSERRESRARKGNTAINNCIIDLMEDKAFIASPDNYDGALLTRGSGQPRSEYAKEILDIGFGKRKTVTAKKFHENLYNSRSTLIGKLDGADIPALDFTTSPLNRVQNSDDSLAAFVPLIILGSYDGTGHNAVNSHYSDDASYAGAGDFGGGSGGDGGGGDGGGGGGGD